MASEAALALCLCDLVDEGGLLCGVGYGTAAHFGGVGDCGGGIIAKVTENGAGEHAGAADAGVAMECCVFTVLDAGGDGLGESVECCGGGQVHVTDGVAEEGDAVFCTGFSFVFEADSGGFLRFQQGDDGGDACAAGGFDVII